MFLFEKLERIPHDYYKHMQDIQHISNTLHDKTTRGLSLTDEKNLWSYTNEHNDHSKILNTSLIKNKPLGKLHSSIHETIKKNSKPSGMHISLYSGTQRDFSKLAKQSENGILHSPAHISTTHDFETAETFANQFGQKYNHKHPVLHILKINIKPKDKILHVSKYSNLEDEHETIIPAGTKLKYHKTDTYLNSPGYKTKIHHFAIHSQE